MSATTDLLEINLARKTEQVRLKDASTGEVQTYTLKEMSGFERDQWMNRMSKSLKVGADGKSSGVSDYTGIHYSLIARCLYDASDKLVSEDIIRNWPASAQKVLFDKCQALNGLNDDTEGTEGKAD